MANFFRSNIIDWIADKNNHSTIITQLHKYMEINKKNVISDYINNKILNKKEINFIQGDEIKTFLEKRYSPNREFFDINLEMFMIEIKKIEKSIKRSKINIRLINIGKKGKKGD